MCDKYTDIALQSQASHLPSVVLFHQQLPTGITDLPVINAILTRDRRDTYQG